MHDVVNQEETLLDAAVGARVTTGARSRSHMIGDAWSDTSTESSVRAVSGSASLRRESFAGSSTEWVSPFAPVDITPLARAWCGVSRFVDDMWGVGVAVVSKGRRRGVDMTSDPSPPSRAHLVKRPLSTAHLRAMSSQAVAPAVAVKVEEDVSKAGTFSYVAGGGSSCAATDAMAQAPVHADTSTIVGDNSTAPLGREKMGVLPVEADTGMKDIEDPKEHLKFARAATAASGAIHATRASHMRTFTVSEWPHDSMRAPPVPAPSAEELPEGGKRGGALAFGREQAQEADDARVVAFGDEAAVPRHRWSRSEFDMLQASDANPYMEDIMGGTQSGVRKEGAANGSVVIGQRK